MTQIQNMKIHGDLHTEIKNSIPLTTAAMDRLMNRAQVFPSTVRRSFRKGYLYHTDRFGEIQGLLYHGLRRQLKGEIL